MQTRNALGRRVGALALTTTIAAAAVLTVTTGAGADHDSEAVELGAAGAFAVLAPAAVTNTGATTVTGGSVGSSTAVTGFDVPGGPGTIVGGTAQTNTESVQQALAALGTAYTDAAGRLPDTLLADAQLGGLTLTPGVYRSTPAVLLLDGPLTLSGGADSVFIFQATSGFDVGAGGSVEFTGGAQACNVFFQVAGGARLLDGADFAGTILARSAITVADGASVEGRLFARDENVTLIDNDILVSACGPDETTTSSSSTSSSSTSSSTSSSSTSSTTTSTTTVPTSSTTSTTGPTTSTTAATTSTTASTPSTTATTVVPPTVAPTTVVPTTSTTGPTGSTTSTTAATTSTTTSTTTPTTAPPTTTTTTPAPGVPGVVGPPRTGGAPSAPAGSPWSGVAATALLSGAGALGVVLHRRERTARVELPVE